MVLAFLLVSPALRAQALVAPAALAELAQPRLAGSGHYSWWGFDIYQASLWVEPGFDSRALTRQRFVLDLNYQRAFKGGDIAQRSIEEMRRIGTFSEEKARLWLQAMRAAFPDVHPGDRLSGLHLPGRGAQFFVNGRPTAPVADAEFAQLFFGIWLSDRTSEPRLRLALLGPAVTGQ